MNSGKLSARHWDDKTYTPTPLQEMAMESARLNQEYARLMRSYQRERDVRDGIVREGGQ